MTPKATHWDEAHLAEDPAVELLQSLGYTYVPPEDLERERHSHLAVVTRNRTFWIGEGESRVFLPRPRDPLPHEAGRYEVGQSQRPGTAMQGKARPAALLPWPGRYTALSSCPIVVGFPSHLRCCGRLGLQALMLRSLVGIAMCIASLILSVHFERPWPALLLATASIPFARSR